MCITVASLSVHSGEFELTYANEFIISMYFDCFVKKRNLGYAFPEVQVMPGEMQIY